jgi:hypothetical protein
VERLGYLRYGELADCPPGVNDYYYWKPLTGAGDAAR